MNLQGLLTVGVMTSGIFAFSETVQTTGASNIKIFFMLKKINCCKFNVSAFLFTIDENVSWTVGNNEQDFSS